MEMGKSMPLQMICHSSLRRSHYVRLCIDPGGHTAFMASPVIQKLWNMHDMLCPVCHTKDHIVILTSVKPGTEQLLPFQKPFCKHAEMTDIIIGPQIVHRIIRLEMHGQHFVDITVLKCGLITVNIIGILLVDCLHIFVQRTRMQDIIMIKQSDIFPCSKLQALIGISGNPFIL